MTIAGHAAMRFWLRPGGLATTTTRGYSVFLKWQGGGLIGLSTKTLRSVAPSSTWAASYLHPSSVAFITTIAESSFQYTQAVIREAGTAAGTGQFAGIQGGAPGMGLELSPIGVRDVSEMERAIA